MNTHGIGRCYVGDEYKSNIKYACLVCLCMSVCVCEYVYMHVCLCVRETDRDRLSDIERKCLFHWETLKKWIISLNLNTYLPSHDFHVFVHARKNLSNTKIIYF